MRLPVMPPLGPMLAKSATDLPVGEGWLFEPKWDGFRCIVFRDGDEVELGSRNERPLTRYFPELPPALQAALPERCVVDGELVVPSPAGLDFDALQQRIHPAASRVNRLAAETPTHFLAFDLLASGDEDLREVPLVDRRARLAAELRPQPLVHLSPCTTDRDVAMRWFEQFEGAGLDGIVAKRLADTYRPDERTMVKVKHSRTADCVVAGFRWHKDGQGIGSLLLGLYDGDGELHHVGVCGSFTAKKRRELVSELEPLRKDALADHPWREWADAMAHATAAGRMPGSPSRWNAKKDLSWDPLRPERVCEVAFTQLTNGRFRHNAQFVRWRDDREPRSCTYDQLEVVTPVELAAVLAGELPGT
ncbi:MAG: ATP-dependent DNA ligase [Acidimicrobiales bacterium]